jgi:hypothetical protein
MINFVIDNDKKIEYLKKIKEKYEPATFELYQKLIYKLDEYEEYKGISAMNMTKQDFLDLLTVLNSSSLNALYTYKSAISNYLISSTDIQKFKIGILEIDKITKDELLECANTRTEESQFITEQEYYDILNNPNGNYQDRAIIVLLWNKIKGLHNFDEIREIKNKDVDLENKIINFNGRIIKFTEKEMDIIGKAIEEKEYIKITKDEKITIPFIDGQYLIKATMGRRNLNAVNNQTPVSSLMNRISKYFNFALGRAELTGLKIYKSSVYYYMLMNYKRKLTNKELKEYFEENNYRLSMSNSYREQDIMYNKLIKQGLI